MATPHVGAHIAAPPPVSPVEASLARNQVGTLSILLVTVAAAAPLTVEGAIGQAYKVTGFMGIPAGYIGVLIVLLIFSVGFLAMSRRIGNAGAFYSYVAAGLGKHLGVAAAFVALFSYTLMELGLIGGFGAFVSLAVQLIAGVSVPWLACALVAWLVISVLGLFGIRINARFLGVALAAEIGIVVLYDTVLIGHPYQGHYDFAPFLPASLFAAGGVALFCGLVASYSGFETGVVLREESRGARSVSAATFWALGICGVLYAATAWALPVATGSANVQAVATADDTQFFFDLVQPYVGDTLVQVGQALFLTSLLAGGLAFHNIVSRYLFALGRERVLHEGLKRVGRSGARKAASRLQSLVVLALLLAAWALHADPAVNLYFWMTVTAGFGIVVLMFATSLAVAVYFHPVRDPEGRWRHKPTENLLRRKIAPVTSIVLLLLIIGGTVVQFHNLLALPPGAALAWIAPASFGVVALLGILWAEILRMYKPSTYRDIGLGAQTAVAHAAERAAAAAAARVLTTTRETP